MATTTCAGCGRPLRAGARFCPSCGRPAPDAPPAEDRAGGAATPPASPAPPIVAGTSAPATPPTGAGAGAQAGAARGPANWGQRIWDGFSVAVCTAISAGWFWYSGLASRDTPPDLRTCLTIIALPVLTIVLRRPLDRLLARIVPYRNRLPRLVRLGAGLAAPLLVTNYLYASGVTQYEFMFRTVVVSTVLSFVILRNPVAGRVAASVERVLR